MLFVHCLLVFLANKLFKMELIMPPQQNKTGSDIINWLLISSFNHCFTSSQQPEISLVSCSKPFYLGSQSQIYYHLVCSCATRIIYQGESKVLQYFGNVRHNSIALDVLAEGVKVTSHTGLWDAELAWYSPSATQQICLYGFEHNLGIHGFRPTWTYLWYLLNHLLTVLWSNVPSPFGQQMFLIASTMLCPSLNL